MRFLALLLIGLCAVSVAAPPFAEAKPRSRRVASKKAPPTPWSVGVPEAAQKRALELFREGNAHFEEAKYTEAVAKYEVALSAWDHPNIRFNMALCLINMRQPLAAWAHLQQALRFGEAPLGKRLFDEARRTASILDSSLSELTVKASQPDIRVMVDGALVLDGPGAHTLRLLPGKHQLVASRRGYVTDSRALDLPPGRSLVEQISLVREQVRVVREGYDRRWSWWVPWSVAGTSVLLGLVGGGIYLDARSDIREYDDRLSIACPSGCTPAERPQELKDLEKTARRNSGIAVGVWAAAGAVAITGGVMAILNRPRPRTVRRMEPVVSVSADHVGLGVSLDLD